jgi:hypothetical protein
MNFAILVFVKNSQVSFGELFINCAASIGILPACKGSGRHEVEDQLQLEEVIFSQIAVKTQSDSWKWAMELSREKRGT